MTNPIANDEKRGNRSAARPALFTGRRPPSSLQVERTLPLHERIRRLADDMRSCIAPDRRTARFIDLSTPPHREITEALRILVYEPGTGAAIGGHERLWCRYGSSEPEQPFPVRALTLPPSGVAWNEAAALNVGTLTFRHVDYDSLVDLYLIRDRETRTLGSAEIDHLAYTRMKEVLDDPLLTGESFVRIYQTGLEPLVVGLYRAVVEHLRRRHTEGLGPLVIQPVFFLGKSGNTGELWS